MAPVVVQFAVLVLVPVPVPVKVKVKVEMLALTAVLAEEELVATAVAQFTMASRSRLQNLASGQRRKMMRCERL